MKDALPRFHFHFSNNGRLCRDNHGIVFATPEEAYLQANAAAEAMWPGLLRDRTDPMACKFIVTDAQDSLLFQLPFCELVERCRNPSAPEKRRSELTLAIEGNRVRATVAHARLQTEMHQTRRSLDEMTELLRRLWPD